MTRYFNKKTALEAKVFPAENPPLTYSISYGFLAPPQHLVKTHNTIPRTNRQLELWKDRRTDRRTSRLYFIQLFSSFGGKKESFLV